MHQSTHSLSRIYTMSSTQDKQGASTIIRPWEASKLLSIALSNYIDSCAALEKYCQRSQAGAESVSTSVNFPSFESLHAKLSNDLIQARITVARTRNTVSSRFNSLPQEIITKIFLAVVYSPVPSALVTPDMRTSLQYIFLRIDKLISICSFWRDIALSLDALWYFVPVIDNIYGGRRMRRTAPLSLQRSGTFRAENRMHLVAMRSPDNTDTKFPSPDGRAPAFHAISIDAFSIRAAANVFYTLIKTQVPRLLSELSIYIGRGSKLDPNIPVNYFTHFLSDSDNSRFIELIGSLSILRLGGTNIHWDQIKFSDRLIHFHLEGVTLGGYSKLTGLLQILQSAPELRTLRLRRVICNHESSATSTTRIVFPKLESLYLDDLNFGVLQVVFNSVVPGSHHRTLSLTEIASSISVIENLNQDEDEEDNQGQTRDRNHSIDHQRVADLLKRSWVNTLMLNGYFRKLWIDPFFLRMIVESLSATTTLQLVNTGLSKEQLLALERPNPQNDNFTTSSSTFPTLVDLSIISTRIVDTDALKRMVESHHIQNMELSSKVAAIDYDGCEDPSGCWGPDYCHTFAEDDEIVQWLKSNVPQFHLVDDTWGAKHGIQRGGWPLW